MITIENTEVGMLETAMRAMRNPKNSWHLNDTTKIENNNNTVTIGPKDLDLARRLISGGTEHRKFLRQITVACDIVAPFYWWAEMDTYKIGTTRNSCSFMHKGVSKEFSLDDFVTTGIESDIKAKDQFLAVIEYLNELRRKYLETKDPNLFYLIRQILPSGYKYRATWSANYEVLYNIYRQRKNHRLIEWREFCSWIETLPYMNKDGFLFEVSR